VPAVTTETTESASAVVVVVVVVEEEEEEEEEECVEGVGKLIQDLSFRQCESQHCSRRLDSGP
jgi:hypothetical protein